MHPFVGEIDNCINIIIILLIEVYSIIKLYITFYLKIKNFTQGDIHLKLLIKLYIVYKMKKRPGQLSRSSLLGEQRNYNACLLIIAVYCQNNFICVIFQFVIPNE